MRYPRRRGLRRPFPVAGLTGSIAMGKSTAARLLRGLGVLVIDADADVHRFMAAGGAAVAAIAARFPGVVAGNGAVDRAVLGARVYADEAAMKALEGILHPMVRAAREKALRIAALTRRRLVVLDVPLLFEAGMDEQCDGVMVVSAPAFLQRQRALARRGMTEERLARVLARQMPDGEKRRRADAVIPTGLGKRESLRHILKFIRRLA